MQLCSVRLTRWPLNDKPLEFHEDELLTRPHMKYIWAHLPRKVCPALRCHLSAVLSARACGNSPLVCGLVNCTVRRSKLDI